MTADPAFVTIVTSLVHAEFPRWTLSPILTGSRHLDMEPSKAQAQRRELAQLESKKRLPLTEKVTHPFVAIHAELLMAHQTVEVGAYRIA